MLAFRISGARDTFVEMEQSVPILHVVTDLPGSPEAPGYCRESKNALVREIDTNCAASSLGGYEIHWSDSRQPSQRG